MVIKDKYFFIIQLVINIIISLIFTRKFKGVFYATNGFTVGVQTT